MIVLDTNVISEIFRQRPDPKVIAWLEVLADDVAITAITLAELLAGVRRLPEGQRKTAWGLAMDRAIRPYLDTRSVLAFDDASAVEYAEVLVERAGLPISMADAQIAAICRHHRAVCATRNTKDFVRTGVRLVNPWEYRGDEEG